ncbi:NAD(P)/FAD-dependent oxidoreductase [Nocardioides marinquilinus]|uniref:NAD(P)/FAD-dependent oxidoreductase n=1 Tax=Nocardioides marinquilinus TaxID=1210400 RepID=A0ABP9PME5_9ACTN
MRVWEPRSDPVDKACGEGLMPGALALLAELDVDPPGHALRGIRYVGGGRAATADFGAGPGRGVRRTALHDALAHAVREAGVTVEHRTAREVRQDDAGVTVDGERAGHLVAADGLHSPLRRALGLERAPRARRRHGLRRHYRLAPWTSYVEVHWGAAAEAYVTPVADDLVGVAVLTSQRAGYDEHLAAFPALRERLAGAEPDGDVRGAGPLRQRTRARTAGRVLLVGDAAGYVDALTGEGVALGLAQARAAVDAVAAGDVARYEREWPRLTRRYRWLTAGLVAATRPAPARRAIVPVARAARPVFGLVVDQLASGHGRDVTRPDAAPARA